MAQCLSRYSTDRHYAGSYANAVLYRLCEENPCHEDIGVVAAKIGLISRFYSASPKRGVGANREGDNSSFFDRLAEYFCQSHIDEWIREASDAGTIDTTNLDIISNVHRRVCETVVDFINIHWNLGTVNRSAQDRKSFVSKYLHFHAPAAFPLYDSVILSRLKLSPSVSYRMFCEEFLADAERRFGKKDWTPRLLDKVLYPYEAV